MIRDFTLKKYGELLAALGPGDFTFHSYLNNENQSAILRHDVDRNPKYVIAMAKLENKRKVKATYYFRVKPNLFNREIISRVKKLGHEVGYHYEILDKARGNYSKAIELFKKEWMLFREWDAKTICMHGNPLSKIDNKSIWKEYDFKEYDVSGEAYTSVNFDYLEYLTDTGRCWNNDAFSVKDKAPRELFQLKGTENLIDLIKRGKIKTPYILTHPSRWNDSYLLWTKELIGQNLKNIIKRCIVRFRR
jgi:hypothetical protein